MKVVAETFTPQPHHRLFMKDRITGQPFLIDTGASISLLPVPKGRRRTPSDFTLIAANNSTIATYGEVTREVDLGLQKPLRWTYILADVAKAILGADFLYWHQLTVDLRNRRLLDQRTGRSTTGTISSEEIPVYSIMPTNNRFARILNEFPTITKVTPIRGPPSGIVEHIIETKGRPVTAKCRRLPPGIYQDVRKEIKNLIKEGICRPSKSPWSSPLHVVKKKDGSLRLCGDYRALNALTIPDRYGIPNLRDFTMELCGKKIFSKIDLRRAYYHIPITEKDREKTAIITPFGLIEYNRMNFGLRNAGQSFQRFVDDRFRDLSFLFKFLDDFLIASENEDQHEAHLREVFRRLDMYGIAVNPAKCIFGVSELDFLGYHLTTTGITPLDYKVKSILQFPPPKDVRQLRRFMGMVNFYRPCLPKAATIQQPLNDLLHNKKKNDRSPILWNDEAIKAFEETKKSLAQASELIHPDPDAEISLACDASDSGIGAVFQQKKEEIWYPLSFFSQALNNAQKNYSVYDRELLAIYKAIRHFQPLLEGRNFSIITDHRPLIHAFTQKSESATPLRIRWLSYISQFTTQIIYRPGKDNVVADSLSRIEEIQTPDDFVSLANAQKADPDTAHLKNQENLKFKLLEIPGTDRSLLCEMSTSKARPYLPPDFRHAAFQKIHNLSHPSIRTTRKMVAQRFFWPSINKDTTEWARCCLACQKSKIHRHTVTPPGKFQPVDRFQHVHLDLIGPLPPSNGFKYCLTMIDRQSRWTEAIPLQDIMAETVSDAFYSHWVCRFGVPSRITTDQGRQFESQLFHQLTTLLGIQRNRTTAYHPQSNGCVERWHRTLKSAITAHMNSANWTRVLPTVLLGLRASLRDDTSSSIAEALYGSAIRLPGEFLEARPTTSDPHSSLQELKDHISKLRPAESRSSNKKTFVHDELRKCTHVFVREDRVKQPLVPPYSGPHKVLERNEKYFLLQLPSRKSNISLDRLKPAFLPTEDSHQIQQKPQLQTCIKPAKQDKTGQDPKSQQQEGYKTRSGRLVKPKVRFIDSVIKEGNPVAPTT